MFLQADCHISSCQVASNCPRTAITRRLSRPSADGAAPPQRSFLSPSPGPRRHPPDVNQQHSATVSTRHKRAGRRHGPKAPAPANARWPTRDRTQSVTKQGWIPFSLVNSLVMAPKCLHAITGARTTKVNKFRLVGRSDLFFTSCSPPKSGQWSRQFDRPHDRSSIRNDRVAMFRYPRRPCLRATRVPGIRNLGGPSCAQTRNGTLRTGEAALIAHRRLILIPATNPPRIRIHHRQIHGPRQTRDLGGRAPRRPLDQPTLVWVPHIVSPSCSPPFCFGLTKSFFHAIGSCAPDNRFSPR